MTPAKQRSLPRRVLPRIVAALGLVAAVLLSWWMRIEDARTADTPPRIALGQPVDLGRVMLTPLSLAVAPEGDGPPQLVLRARLENLTGRTEGAVFGFPPRPPLVDAGQADFPQPEIFLDRDGEYLRHVQPRIPEEVTITWDIPADWQPQEISLIFFRQNFKLRDNLYGQSNWLGFDPAARLTAIPEGPA